MSTSTTLTPDAPRSDLLCWIDLETTGLEPERGRVLELGMVFTDKDLNELFAQSWVVAHQLEHIECLMEPVVERMHTNNGLLREVLDPQLALPLQVVEDFALGYARSFSVIATAPLCGNTISFDRAWLRLHLPRLHEHLNYRNIDVSTIKRLGAMWRPELPDAPKANIHRALPDVIESITELRYWKQQWLTPMAPGVEAA